jgi:oligosaccharide repeat unit polymerase
MKFPREYAFFSEPYMYISMNLENMVRAVEKLEYFSYGLMTFEWAYALFGIKHWMTDYFNIIPRPFIISGYNTYPFHWYYYYDFGLLGIVIFSLLTGFLIGVVYYKMRLTASPKWIALYSIGLGFIVISFFTNPFTMLNFAVSFSLLWLIHHFFIKGRTSVSLRA